MKIRSEYLKNILKVLRVSSEESVIIKCEDIFIQVVAISPSHVSLIQLIANDKLFEEYDGGGEEIGIKIYKLLSYLKSIDGFVEISSTENKIKIKDGRGIEYSFTQADITKITRPNVPERSRLTRYTLSFDSFYKYFEVFSDMGLNDYLSILGDEDGNITLQCQKFSTTEILEQQIKSVSVELPEPLDNFPLKFPLKCQYNVDDYLGKFINQIAEIGCETVDLIFKNNFPLVIEAKLMDDCVKVMYMLAPRLE